MTDVQEFFAAAIPGTERVLCDELRELGFESVRLNRGGVPFRGPWREGWRACLGSRIAQRIQALLGRFPASSEDALYDGVRNIDWSPFLSSRQTLSVSAVCRGSAITHSGFAALKVKDAICDRVRATTGGRPDVDRDDPDVRIFLYLANDKATLYIDLAGDPLHRRGYRTGAGDAPLRETLAAAILRLSGWDREMPLYDPMCGSGTIAIEAAMWASNVAPGLSRSRFGFERWESFGDAEAGDLRSLIGELRASVQGKTARITASDSDAEMIETAKANARAAGVRPAFRCRNITDLQGGDDGIVVTNPPYGVRLEKDADLSRRFAAAVSRLHGWRVCVLAGCKDYERDLSLRPKASFPITNGDIECDFLIYDIP